MFTQQSTIKADVAKEGIMEKIIEGVATAATEAQDFLEQIPSLNWRWAIVDVAVLAVFFLTH